MIKSIVITSGKGGVGKSTTAASLGAGLASAGYKTVILDMDIGLRSLDMFLGLENEMIYDLVDVSEGSCSIDEALYQVKSRDNLYLLPASQLTDTSSVSLFDVEAIVDGLRDRFDYVLIDCPAGIGRGFRNACSAADSAIIVLTPEPLALRDAERVKQLLNLDGIADVSLLINRVARRNPVSTDECIRRMGCPVLGFVPDDARVSACCAKGVPVLETESDAGDAFERITRRFLGQPIKYKIPHDSLIHKIKTHFGRECACKS